MSRLRRSVFDEFMKPMAMTRSQWWILAHLSRHDGMIQSDLANVLDIGKAALGGLIDRLEASKFIERRADGDRHDRQYGDRYARRQWPARTIGISESAGYARLPNDDTGGLS